MKFQTQLLRVNRVYAFKLVFAGLFASFGLLSTYFTTQVVYPDKLFAFQDRILGVSDRFVASVGLLDQYFRDDFPVVVQNLPTRSVATKTRARTSSLPSELEHSGKVLAMNTYHTLTPVSTPKVTIQQSSSVKNRPTTSVDESVLNLLISKQLSNLSSIGLLKGDKGDKGEPGTSATPTYGSLAAPALVSFNPQSGGTDFSANTLSSQALTVAGTTTLSGTVNLAGTTNITNLTVTSASSIGDITPSTAGSLSAGMIKKTLATPGSTGLGMALGADGFARMAYIDVGLKYIRCTNSDCSSSVTTTVVNSAFTHDLGNYIMALGQDGYARILYEDPGDGHLNMVRCKDDDCVTKNTNVIDSDAVLYPGYYGANIRMGNDGFPKILAANGEGNETMRYTSCSDIDCTVKTTQDVVDSYNYPSSFDIGLDGFARFGYEDFNDYKFYFVRCTNASCSTKVITLLDGGANYPGTAQTVRLGSDDFARIISVDESGALTYYKCTDANCTAPVITTLPATDGYPNNGIGMDLRAGDLASIAYADTAGRTHILNCTNVNCTTYNDVLIGTTYSWPLSGGASLVLGSSGMPHLLYSDYYGTDLRYVKLNSLDGTTLVASGSVLGTSTTPYGNINSKRITADELFIQGDSTNSLLIKNSSGSVLLNADSSTGNIGIGTLNPEFPLDINGTFRSGNYRIYSLDRYIDETANRTVELGSFNGYQSYDIFVHWGAPCVASDKRYIITDTWASSSDWVKVMPISASNTACGNDFALDIKNDGTVKFRLRRTSGNTPATAQITIISQGYQPTIAFTPSTTTGTASAPTGFFKSTALTQYNGNVGIGTTNPQNRLYVVGPVQNGVYAAVIDGTAEGQAGSQSGLNILAGDVYLNAGPVQIKSAAPYLNVLGAVNGNFVATFTNSPAGSGYGIRVTTDAASGNNPIIQADIGGAVKFQVMSSGNVGIGTSTPVSLLDLGSSDLGNGAAGPTITLGRNTNATNTGAGSINFQSKAGTAGFVWQDAAGNLRIHTAAPSNANDTAGTVVGTQTSTRETKQDITSYTDYAAALQAIVNAPLHNFRYIKEVEGYGSTSPLAKNHIGFIADEVSSDFMQGNSIDQVSVNGLLMASIKALNEKLAVVSENKNSDITIITQQLYLSQDNVGQAKILAGSTSVRVTFSKPYEYQPVVVITPNSRVGGEYWIGDKDATGFTIYVDPVKDQGLKINDLVFDYHSFASPEAKLTVSDGTTEDLVLVVPKVASATVVEQPPLSNDAPIQPTPPEPPAVIQPAPTDILPPQEAPVVPEVVTDQPIASPSADPQAPSLDINSQ